MSNKENKTDEIRNLIKQNKKIVKHIKSMQVQLDWIIMVFNESNNLTMLFDSFFTIIVKQIVTGFFFVDFSLKSLKI